MFGYVFFFKQKTAYEMRTSDWSSDVCSSDLLPLPPCQQGKLVGQAGKGDLLVVDEDPAAFVDGKLNRLILLRQRGRFRVGQVHRNARHQQRRGDHEDDQDRKSTRLNSSH